jgi:hypothetical protein
VDEQVSLATIRDDYEIWRWRVELDPSRAFVDLWAAIGASNHDQDTKVRLADVVWALSAFERAYNVLLADIVRVERWHNSGVPAAVDVLTGPYQDSLNYLLVTSLWMDLGDVLVAYRTIVECFGFLKRSVKGGVVSLAKQDVERELGILRNRKLPPLSGKPVTELANAVLHATWHPARTPTLELPLYWKGSDPRTLDFTEEDLRTPLDTLVDETVNQVHGYISTTVR